MFYDKFLSSILKKFNLVKINEEKFQENTQVGMLSIIISLITIGRLYYSEEETIYYTIPDVILN